MVKLCDRHHKMGTLCTWGFRSEALGEGLRFSKWFFLPVLSQSQHHSLETIP